ncbi:Protease Do-like 1, chloroplastic [Hordeum vulgare]|nr:Protease Do-like 1, chloroplastic [Hordeum vulgare]
MAAAASFLAAPSPLARPPRPRPRLRHSLRHLARAAAARPPAGPLAPPASPSPWRLLRGLALRDLAVGPVAEAARRALAVATGPLVVALASAALILGDAGRTSAFVVATPRKLQADELTTVRLFKDNTPSVVYITNLAVRQDAFTLDVLEVPQGSGSGFVWDKLSHIVTNFHVICGASDLRLGDGASLVLEMARPAVFSFKSSGFDLAFLGFCQVGWIAEGQEEIQQQGRLDQQGRLELAERRRRKLELPDRRPNLSNNSKEDATRCLVSLGDLIDVKKLGGSAAGSDTLHLRVTGMATAGLLSAMRDYTIRISTS